MTLRWTRHLVAVTLVLASGGATSWAQERAPFALTGDVREHEVVAGDTLYSLAARFGVDVATLAAGNVAAAGDRLRAGQTLHVDSRHIVPAGVDDDTLVVNLPQRHLFVRDAERIRALPVAVGRRTWPTPTGEMRIVAKETDPTWDVPESIRAEAQRAGKTLPRRVPPGPANPLGAFWLGLSGGGVGLHGTNVPSSIYKAVTHGCVRLHPDDIAWLYPRVALGTRVVLVYQPVLLAAVGEEVWLEAHPDIYGRLTDGRAEARKLADAAGLTSRIDWTAAAAVLAARHGVARAVGR